MARIRLAVLGGVALTLIGGLAPLATRAQGGSPAASESPAAASPSQASPVSASPAPVQRFPDPVAGVSVYDEADVFGTVALAEADKAIAAIEAATGSDIVVYTQVKPEVHTDADAVADATALVGQWALADPYLVILIELDDSRCHGNAQLYASPGFDLAFAVAPDRQRIFDEEVLPRLRVCDLDGALLAALASLQAASVAPSASPSGAPTGTPTGTP